MVLLILHALLQSHLIRHLCHHFSPVPLHEVPFINTNTLRATTETLTVSCPLETKSQEEEEAFQAMTVFAKDQSSLGRAIDKICTPIIAITSLSPAPYTTTQQKRELELQNTDNIKHLQSQLVTLKNQFIQHL